MAALIAGERNPAVLAQLARSSMRRKITELEEAFTGHFDDHHRFLLARTEGHLCSWAKFSPGINSSAGKTKGNGSTGHGNRYLARVLGEAAVVAGKTDTFLGERYRRIARRRGKKRAIVAIGRSILVIIWHLLQDPNTRFHDLGADHFSRHTNPDTEKHGHIRQLEALGYTVTLTPPA